MCKAVIISPWMWNWDREPALGNRKSGEQGTEPKSLVASEYFSPWCFLKHPCFSSRPHAATGCDWGQQGIHGAEWGTIRCTDGLSLAALGHSVFRDTCHDVARIKEARMDYVKEIRDSSKIQELLLLEMFCKILRIKFPEIMTITATLLPSFERVSCLSLKTWRPAIECG